MSESEATLVELNEVLSNTAFLKHYRFRVLECAPDECTMTAPFDPDFERPGGIVSGMTLMGAADVAMWLAIMTRRGVSETWVTSDMKTAFLKSAREEVVSCTARILKLGRRTAYGTVECNSASSLLAHHVITYVKVDS